MSVDLLGPASDQAVTVRPGRVITRGTADTWFKDCSSADANDGTAFVADFFNDTLAQFRVAMRSSGITLDGADDMLWRAMQSIGLRYALDSGAANHLTAAFVPPVANLYDGLAVLIKVLHDVTGATDITANATATSPLVWPDGTPIASGDIKAGSVILVVYAAGSYQLLCRMNGGSAAAANFVPGCIYQWPMDTAPAGTLGCDGAAVSRSTYSRLFGVIGTSYGPGNGTTTFNVPNFEGEFLRGRDNGRGADPDAAARTNRGDGVTGDHVGTKQAASLNLPNFASILTTPITLPATDFSGGIAGYAVSYSYAGDPDPTKRQPYLAGPVTFSGASGSETRPRNVSVLYVIAI